MKYRNFWKRTAAGLIALLLVSGCTIPTNVNIIGSFDKPKIVANAATTDYSLLDETVGKVIGNVKSDITMIMIGTTGGKIVASSLPATDDNSGRIIRMDNTSAPTAVMILYDKDHTITPAEAKEILKSIQFTDANTQVHIDVTSGESTDAIVEEIKHPSGGKVTFGVQNADGQAHAYKFMPGNKTWIQAFHDSVTGTETIGGLKGYLATITTDAEATLLNTFYKAVTTASEGAWIAATSMTYGSNKSKITPENYGGSGNYTSSYHRGNEINAKYPSYYQHFYWACGPEQGQTPSSTLYANGEPNNYSPGEECIVASYSNNKTFNDYPYSQKVAGYFLEFSVYSNGFATRTVHNTTKVYRVKYDANGATGGTAPDTQQKLVIEGVGDNMKLADKGTLVKQGFNFAGWSTNKNATAPEYLPGDVFSTEATTTLYAVWTDKPTITTHPQDITLEYDYTSSNVLSVGTSVDNDSDYIREYQWYQNSTSSTEGATAIEGATGPTVIVPSGLIPNKYYYYCIVKMTNSAGDLTAMRSRIAEIDVTKANPIIVPPVVASNLAYDGTYQQLIAEAGSVNAGAGTKLLYAVNTNPDLYPLEDEGWTDSITADDVKRLQTGTYYVWYKVTGSQGYFRDIEPTCCHDAAVINPRQLTLIWGNTDLNYTGSSQIPTFDVSGLVSDSDKQYLTISGAKIDSGNGYTAYVELTNSNYIFPDSKTQLSQEYNILAKLDVSAAKNTKGVSYIEKIEYEDDNIFNSANDVYYVKNSREIKITSKGKLNFSSGVTVTETKDKNYFYYVFTIPEGENVNVVSSEHEYDYRLRTNPDDETELLGTDRNDKNAVEELVAKLYTEDFEYLADNPTKAVVENNAFLTVDETNTTYTYTAKTDDVPLVDEFPFYVGDYKVVAGVRIKNATYYINDEFSITPRIYANHTDEIKVDYQCDDYTGKEITPVITVTDSNEKLLNHTLVEGVDYDLSGDLSATDAGNYTATVTFKGNYSGTATLNWTIQPQKLAAVTIQPDSNLVYNREGHPASIVVDGDSVLPKPIEELFEITYRTDSTNFGKNAPVSAGTYYAFATIKDTNYTFADGTTRQVSEAFTVTPRPVTVTPVEASKTFREADPTFSCTTTDEIALADDMDFSGKITREEGEDAGTYDYLLKDADENDSLVFGNYKLSLAENSPKFTINKKEVSPTVNVNGEYIYNGQPHEASVMVKDNDVVIDPSQYEVSYDNNVNAGDEAVVTVTAKEDGNYIFTASENFTIKPKSIAGVTITLPEEQYVANGTTEVQPVPTVKDPEIDDDVLEEGKDYTVSYEDNVNAGKQAKVIVTGMGNYDTATSASKEFEICATIDVSAVSNKIYKIEKDGVEILPDSENWHADGKYICGTGVDFTIYSYETLAFSPITVKEYDEDNDGYWYTINIPEDTNYVTVTHDFDYEVKTDGDKAYGYDRNDIQAEERLIAQLLAENIEYLDSLEEKVKINIPEGAGVTISGEKFEYSPINNDVPLVDGIPVNVGTYKVTAKTPIDGTNYYLFKQFSIAHRPYSTHTDEIKITVSNDNAIYNGEDIVPEIVITDSKRAENEQTLVRGKDYELGYINSIGKFIVVNEEDDEYFGQTAVGRYEVDVRFIGNYIGTATAKWSIAKSSLPLLTITPDENLVFNNQAHPVTVTPASALPADNLYTISYQKLDDEEWTDIEDAPVEIGTYRAVLTLTDDTDYQFAEEQSTVCQFAVTPKDIDSDDIEVIFQNETMLNPDGWTEPGEIIVKDTTTGQTLTENTDYILNLTKTMTAGIFNIEVVGMGNYNGCAMRTWTVYGAKDIECDDIQISYVPTVFLKNDGMTDYEGLVIEDTARNKILEEGTDYTVNSNPTQERGKFTLEIMGKGDYTGCALREWMAIAGEEISINSKPELYNIKDNKLRITLTSALAKDDISPIAKIGAIVYRGTEKPAEMTIESAKNNADIYNFSANGNTHSISVRDTEDSVWYVGYVILEDGTIKYDEAKQTSMTALKAETMQFEDTASLYNIKENRLVINITSTGDYPEIISQTGAIVYRGKEKPAEMTIESANSNSTIYNFFDEGDTRSVIVKDTEDSVWYVGYTKYTNGSVRYSEAKWTSMTMLKAQTMQIEDTVAPYNINDNKLVINIASTGDYKETVRKTGAIVYRGQECPAEMTIESANSNSTIYNFFDEGDTRSVIVRDTQNSVWYVGYTEYTDGSVKYGELKQTSMNKLLNSKT